ncbi:MULTISPECIES: TrkH family potassium uptake protein [Deefgea]|uniref:Trk system potassium uptake protein n=1 Tax=Deefgea chitinilytica TaxID=570276 RepID=A0ABS2C7S2_9NEIS|nr:MULTISPECIES: potassium transporter TrkG [Deefgea]MBM5570082.1 TrkH family potassium uptake protein [Deefgea chitinilytica]MBM9887311.1 TrkH family potassium uptake protein [Deefgea sp. CFH1-16]
MQLTQKLLPTVNVVARVSMLFSLSIIVPIIVAWWNNDAGLWPFIDALIGLQIFSAALWLLTRNYRRELLPRDGFILVVGLWTALPAVAAVPLMLYDPTMSFTNAYFETMSALSTTGATVMTGLDHLPASINLWRHLLNWLGGMGIIVLAVAIFPLLGVGGMQLFKAETPGPIKDSKLTPRIHETARNLWLIYAGLTAICTLLLRWVGEMSWLDAVCHAFAAMCLGGFSTHDASVGFFNSPLIEVILMIFMLLAATNFATHYFALSGRKLSVYWRDTEFKAMLLLIVSSTIGLSFFLLWQKTYPDFLTSLRHVSFNLISIATDCGFASVDFGQWPIFAPLVMLLLSCITACAGSTGGGIKMIRTIIQTREVGRQMSLLLHPQGIHPLRVNGQIIPAPILASVMGFIFLYFSSIVVLTFTLLVSGMDFISSFSAIIACINNAGPGLGEVGPASNYSGLTDFQTWVCSFTMLLGRLEIFSVLILFTTAFWRN